MKMLYLFLSLLASQLPLASPIMPRKEQTENGVETVTVSSETSKTPPLSTDTKAQPFLIMEGPRAPSKASSMGSYQAKSRDNQAEIQIRGSSSDRAKRNSPSKIAKQAVAGCRKDDLFVNTSDLGLSTKFIRPESVNAYQCRGNCSMTQWKKFTPHSLLEAFVNKKSFKTDGEGCCVPTKLRPLTVIYYDEERGVFVLRTFQDLIVEECGCY